MKLLAHRGHPVYTSTSVVDVPCKRARAESSAAAASPLDDNDFFSSVLSYVGFGEYFYVAGLCRKWRGCHISFCHADAPSAAKHKLRTLRRAIVITAARLQLALNNGAKLTVIDKEANKGGVTLA
jgi:hypothetical protein